MGSRKALGAPLPVEFIWPAECSGASIAYCLLPIAS